MRLFSAIIERYSSLHITNLNQGPETGLLMRKFTLVGMILGITLFLFAAYVKTTNPLDGAEEFQRKLKNIPIGSYIITKEKTCLRIESKSTDRDSLSVYTADGTLHKIGIASLSYKTDFLYLPGEEAYEALDRSFRNIANESQISNAPKGSLLIRRNQSNGRMELGMIMTPRSISDTVAICWKNGSRSKSEPILPLARKINRVIIPSEQDYGTYASLYYRNICLPEGFRKN